MSSRPLPRAAHSVLGALVLVAACSAARTGAPPSTPANRAAPERADAPAARVPTAAPLPARADTTLARVALRGEVLRVATNPEALDEFTPDVPAVDSGGECVRNDRPVNGGAFWITAYFPTRANAQAVVSLNADTAGRIVRYSERRGLVTFRGIATAQTPAQRDSVMRAAQAATRSTMITLDYITDRAFLSNIGGGLPDEAVSAPVAQVEHLARLGRPGDRIARVQQLCGLSLGAPLRPSTTAAGRDADNPRFERGWRWGRARLNDRVGVVWVLDADPIRTDAAKARVRALFLIRGAPGWLRSGVASRAPMSYPPMPEATGELTGSRVDTVWLRLDRAANTAWVHTIKVPLTDGNNVIFVDNGDGKNGPLTVSRVFRTTEAIALGIYISQLPDEVRGIAVSLPGAADFLAGR